MSELGKPSPKIRKKTENQSQNATCEHKTTSEMNKFGPSTDFLLRLNIRVKKFHAAKITPPT